MANTIKPMDNTMLTKLGDKAGSTRDALSTSGVHRHDKAEVAKGNSGSSDTVKLTSGAQLLERLEKTLAGLPEIDAGRVAAVKTAIANGDYEVNASKIADALIRTDRQFGN